MFCYLRVLIRPQQMFVSICTEDIDHGNLFQLRDPRNEVLSQLTADNENDSFIDGQ